MRITQSEMSNESVSSAAARASVTKSSAQGPDEPATRRTSSAASSASLSEDSTHISAAASLVSHTMSLPEMNADKVNDVQMALQTGQFQINSGRVASALIQTMLDGTWS